MFQSTRLHEARLSHGCARCGWSRFQSTRLHEARLGLKVSSGDGVLLFQSTRLHEARPFGVCAGGVRRVVSIHAPA